MCIYWLEVHEANYICNNVLDRRMKDKVQKRVKL